MTVSLPACAIDQRRTPGIGVVCWRHHDALADLLDPDQHGTRYNPERPDDPRVWPSIPVLHAMLDARPGVSGEQLGGSSAFGSRPPANLHVIAIRDPRSRPAGVGRDDELTGPAPTHAVLSALYGRVDFRDINGQPRAVTRQPTTVHTLAVALHSAAGWLCHQPWIDETYRALRTLSGQLRAATGDAPARSIGLCHQPVDDNGHPNPDGPWSCARPLYVPTLPPRAADEPLVMPSLRCNSCGHRYSGLELVQLGQPTQPIDQMAAAS
jgi:hypothetical protein